MLRRSCLLMSAPIAAAASFSSTAARRVALVTGGGRGIGFELVRQLASADTKLTVLLGARDPARGHDSAQKLGLPNVAALELDVTSASSLQAAAATVAKDYPGGLDILVNNAGIFHREDRSGKPHAIDETFAVNYEGPRDTTMAFWPQLKKNARVVNVSSNLSLAARNEMSAERCKQFDDADSIEKLESVLQQYRADCISGPGGAKSQGWSSSAYGTSKLAINVLSRVLAKKGEKDGITVNAACPGWCQTDMTAGRGAPPLTAEEGASRIAFVATDPAAQKVSGAFWEDRAVVTRE